MRRSWMLAALGVALAAPAGVSAATLTVSFTGAVTVVAPELAAYFAVGAPVSGTFSIVSGLPDQVPNDPGLGVYFPASGFSFEFGTYAASSNRGGVTVQNDFAAGSDLVDRYAGSETCNPCSAPLLGPWSLAALRLDLSGPSTVFSDDSLPADLALDAFTSRVASLAFFDRPLGDRPVVEAELASLTVTVPEPDAPWLLAAALGVGWRTRMLLPRHKARRRATPVVG